MPLSRMDQFLWLAGFVGHIAVLAVIFIRQRFGLLPIFTAFIASNLTRTIVLFSVYRAGSRRAYFVSYWALAIVDLCMQCGIVYELAYRVFRPVGTWAPDTKRGWLILLFSATLVAVALTMMSTVNYKNWEELLVIKGSFFSAVLMAELLVGTVVLSVTAGLPLNSVAGKIAVAFGIYSVVVVLISATHSIFGISFQAHLDLQLSRLRSSIYLCCLASWGLSLWQRLPAQTPMSPQLNRVLRNFASLFPAHQGNKT